MTLNWGDAFLTLYFLKNYFLITLLLFNYSCLHLLPPPTPPIPAKPTSLPCFLLLTLYLDIGLSGSNLFFSSCLRELSATQEIYSGL